MTDQGGWGNWSPQQRPDDPQAATDAPEPAPVDGAPTYGRHGGPDEQPTYQQPTYQQPTYQQPTYQQPTYEQPTYEQPTQQPAYEPPPYQQPGYDQQPNYGQPVYDQPAYDQPAYDPQQYGGVTAGRYDQQHQPPQDTQQTQVYGAYGYQGTPTSPGQPVPYGQYGPQPGPAPTGKKRSRGKLALILGIVVVLVAGLGVGAWALFLRAGPAVTWQGKEVADPDAVLTEAQNDLSELVSDVKGVKADDTRCYYAVPKSPPKDTPETDVADTVYCGPALFVDGDTSKPYVPYGISAGSAGGDKVTLTVSAKGTEDGATSVPDAQKLVRPDGASAPSGTGGLAVPEPPPADENVFTSVSDVDVPDAPAGATMAALNGGVTIEKLGEIKRYGTGSDARSAPDGQKLIAFQLGDAAGDGASDGPSSLDLTVAVDGGAGQDIPDLSGINVIAVPTDATTVDLVTKANKVTQSLSLLDGKPGAGNITVLARANRFGSFTVPAGFSFTETGGGASANRPCTLTGSVAGLFYWADDEGTATASKPGDAILETDLKYVFSTDSPAPFQGSSAGDSATFEPSHLTLTLPSGQKLAAKTVADRTVFEVPANFTEGTITIGGSFTNTNAITFNVPTPVSFKVSIPTS